MSCEIQPAPKPTDPISWPVSRQKVSTNPTMGTPSASNSPSALSARAGLGCSSFITRVDGFHLLLKIILATEYSGARCQHSCISSAERWSWKPQHYKTLQRHSNHEESWDFSSLRQKHYWNRVAESSRKCKSDAREIWNTQNATNPLDLKPQSWSGNPGVQVAIRGCS